MIRRLIRERIGVRLMVFFVGAAVILSIPLMATQMYYEYAREKHEIQERVDLVETATIPALRRALWVGDEQHVSALVSGLSRMPMIGRIVLRGEDGATIAAAGEMPTTEVAALNYAITRPYRDRDVFLGNLDIYINRGIILHSVYNRAGFILLVELAKLTLIAAVLFLIVRFMITRQLTVMADYARRISPDSDEPDLTIHRMPLYRDATDELSTLQSAINQMRLGLADEVRRTRAHADTIGALEQRTRAILDAAGEGIIGLDAAGIVTFANTAAANTIGATPDEVLGIDFYSIRQDHIHARHETPTMRCISERRQIRGVQSWRFAGMSEPRTFSFVAAPTITGPSTSVDGCVVVFSDITDHVAMQDALRKLNRELEVRVADETDRRRAQERLLFQQSKFAAMGQMLTAFSHQWRQPLNVIALLVQDLEEAYAAEEVDADYINEMVQRTMRQVMLMSAAVDDFRAFHEPSRTATGFDAREPIVGSLKLSHSLLNYAGITPTLSVCGAPCMLDAGLTPEHDETIPSILMVGYRSELTHVLLALLIAARDSVVAGRTSMVEGMVQGGIIGVALDHDDKNVRIIVTHNGAGDVTEASSPTFDPASEIDSGIGALGLSTARAVLEERLDGRLDIVDSGGVETTTAFIVTVPKRVESRAALIDETAR